MHALQAVQQVPGALLGPWCINPRRMQQLQHRQEAWFGALLPLLLSCTHAPKPDQQEHPPDSTPLPDLASLST